MDDAIDTQTSGPAQPDDAVGHETGVRTESSAVEVEPLPLAGAGGPVGGPVAGEVLDALNQPIPAPTPATDRTERDR